MAKTQELEHELVPKHIKISDKEKEELFERYKISFFDLPRISKADPSLVHLDIKSGDIIKIVKKSKTAGEAVYYRGV